MMMPCLCSFTALRILAADCPVAQKIPKPIGLRIGGGALSTALEPNTSSTIIAKVEGKREGKNRPVATNFQFLKILAPLGQLLVGACLPQTLL